MKIRIGVNKRSVENAISKMQEVKSILQKGIPQKELFEYIFSFFLERANFYLYQSQIGMAVKERIKSSWDCEITGKSLKIVNHYEKSVYVEFGVGIVGKANQHEKAQAAGYEYDVPSPYKGLDGSWTFRSRDLSEMDLPMSDVTLTQKGDGGYWVTTLGTKGVMYAYNALMDVSMDLQNKNGVIATAWKQILRRYLQ